MMDNMCINCFKVHNDNNSPCPYCGYIIGTPPKESFQLYPGTELLGRYIIGQVVGFGGFGTTYKAWDKLCNNIVAIKEYFPLGSVNRNPGESNIIVYTDKEKKYRKGLSSFIGEAASMVKFNTYDSIVNIYNYFEVNNTGYIVMEFLEGQTLSGYLKNRTRKLSLEASIEIIRNVCEALSAVHKVGMVHRDISPENIFICSDGKIKVIDFGAARETFDEEKKMTVILKPGYAPPEQYESVNKQGPWTDIYAVGATLYLLLTGGKPQESTSRIQDDKLIAPCDLDSNIPLYLSDLVMKAMALDIDNRYKTMEEFYQVLLTRAKEIKNIKKSNNNNDELNLNNLTSYRDNGKAYDIKSIEGYKPSRKKEKNTKTKNNTKATVIIGVLLTIVVVVSLVVVLDKAEVFINNGNSKSIFNLKNQSKGNKKQVSIWFTFDEKTEYDIVSKKNGFKQIEKEYEKQNPNVDIQIKYYDSKKYEIEIDKAFQKGKMPDIYESSNLKFKYIANSIKMKDVFTNNIINRNYGVKNLLTNRDYSKKMPLGVKLPIIFINTDRDKIEEGYYNFCITSYDELDLINEPEHILVDHTTCNMYKGYVNLDDCQVTNFDGNDLNYTLEEFLRTDEVYDNLNDSGEIYFTYFFASTSLYRDIDSMVNVEKTSDIPVSMVFYTGDDVTLEFMNCFSISSKSKNMKETQEFFRYLYSDEGQEYMYLDGTGRILPLSKKLVKDYYDSFFNEHSLADVMDKYQVLQ